MISPSEASTRRQQQLVGRNRRLCGLALLTSVAASEPERRAAHGSYGALLLSTALYFLSQCVVCVSELEHLFGVKDQSLQGRFYVVVVLVNLLCNLVLSKAQMSVFW